MYYDMKKSIFLTGVAVLTLAACQKHESQVTTDYLVRVEPVITRATETNFEIGDAIGLSITRAAGVYAVNTLLTYDGTAFSGQLKWYEEGADAATLKAYYPASLADEGIRNPTTFTVDTDQSAGTSASDFMSAVKENVLPSANAVSMVFKHQLSRLVIKVKNNADYTLDQLVLKGAVPTAAIADDLTATVDEQAEAADIKAFADGDTYYVILPAQKVALTAAVTAAGVEMTQKLAEATLAPGKQYTINMIVNPTDIQVVLSGEIENWGDGGEIGAEEPSTNVEEHLEEGYFLYEDVRYNVVKLKDGKWWMAQGLAFVPEGKTPSADPAEAAGIWYPYESNGTDVSAVTDAEVIAKVGYLYDFQTAFSVELTPDNFKDFEATQGICPDGWHIPSRQDFLDLVGLSNKADGETGNKENKEAAYYDEAYGAGKVTALDADGFNWGFTGSVNRTNANTTGAYQKLVLDASVCSVEQYLGKKRLTYLLGSTGFTPTNTAINLQFFSLMNTFSSSYKEGRLSVSYGNLYSGYELRCVRN